MKNFLFSCLCILCLGTLTVNAGVPQVINLNEVVVYGPQGGPQEGTGGLPPCDYCFTASITDDILNVVNDADEMVTVVVTDLSNYNVVISEFVSSELEEQLPAGEYLLEIIPTTYAPMEGYFEVEE